MLKKGEENILKLIISSEISQINFPRCKRSNQQNTPQIVLILNDKNWNKSRSCPNRNLDKIYWPRRKYSYLSRRKEIRGEEKHRQQVFRCSGYCLNHRQMGTDDALFRERSFRPLTKNPQWRSATGFSPFRNRAPSQPSLSLSNW